MFIRASAHSQLEREHAALQAEHVNTCTESDRRIRDLQSEVTALRSRAEQAESERSDAYKRIADWLAKRSGLGTIFEPFESVPDRPPIAAEPVTSSITGRDFVREQAAQYEREVLNWNPDGPAN